ncbi:alpha/beta fold hydrolase [Thioalkalivibrio thiocyanodenitrificans]|uniref:alpha/beta fold hydrolase n=1 Tax=Thioalkalivibrio thiocyanodenitrificans TaxID=243063 RepID=UPI00037FADBC|nr:alpha/beta hydrolase [Thioalkalivibrio thiocyanodenitrificans]
MAQVRQRRSGTVEVGGARLRYVVEGRGTAVLVVGSCVYYPRTFSRRLGASCRLACSDLRHFAAGGGPGDAQRITLRTYAQDIDAVRAALGFERAVLVGHSHHGNVALEYAARFPQRVSHVVLVGTPPCDVQQTITAGDAYWEAHASDARKAVLRRNLTALRAGASEGASPGEDFVSRYVAEGPRYWCDPAYDAAWLWRDVPINMPMLRVFRDFFSNYSLSASWPESGTPVLVIMGRHDYVVPHVLWDGIRSTLPDLSFRLFEHSGHTPQLEEPVLFDGVFMKWLDAHGDNRT